MMDQNWDPVFLQTLKRVSELGTEAALMDALSSAVAGFLAGQVNRGVELDAALRVCAARFNDAESGMIHGLGPAWKPTPKPGQVI